SGESRSLTVDIPAKALLNLRPEAVKVGVLVVDTTTNRGVSNELQATARNFPRPDLPGADEEAGPVGWGRPLEGEGARTLPKAGPDGLEFLRVVGTPEAPGFFLARTEATNRQLKARLKGYDPNARKADEFALDDDAQPAVNLTPQQAQESLKSLSEADKSGLSYRLPTKDEWLRAAKAGKTTAFWWGDEPKYPEGANFLGPEPALMADTTATATPKTDPPTFKANPWGFAHTFGNVAEWATSGDGFVRLGGHFRTEPANPLPEVAVADPAQVGPDAYVGVRPAFDLSAEAGVALIRKALGNDAAFSNIKVAFDPDRALATLTGEVNDPAARRLADRRLGGLWFLAAVENKLVAPTLGAGHLARLGGLGGAVRRIRPIGRTVDEVPVSIRWAPSLPLSGSEYWVNLALPGGGRVSHVLPERSPGPGATITALLDRANVPEGADVTVYLSLGAPAAGPTAPNVVSNAVTLKAPMPKG
ncbi:MAG TPA: SUMF1/EgtB/PvdO family nonheme iron enzyme, partial [Isosphaeraceae bacterium]|nr:SUMF1/EgtB/PvdO family nonheme iron enzyme [Isosphaeraceae bacterium]